MRHLGTITLALSLTACANFEARVPITGKIGGATAFGYAIGRLRGKSNFTVDTVAGLRCDGIYDAMLDSDTMIAEATCNDGRTGQFNVDRKPGTGIGTVVGTLNDGTKAQFVFGKDLRYEDVFPGPDATMPPPVAAPPRRR